MRRSKEEVIAEILEACVIGASKTHVVYGSNLNFRTVIPYLESLMKSGLIAPMNDNPLKYKTTDKGKKFLARLKELHEVF